MKSVEAITLKLRIDPDMADRLNMSRFITRGSMQRKPCWTVSDNIAMIDTVVRQWKCAPIYIIQDIEKKVDEVFDGAHRCEAIFDCINDKFSIEKVPGVDWKTSPLKDSIGKKFSEFTPQIQNLIKDYKFDINIIDDETADDPEALKILWTRLSKAGKELNNFETMIPIHTVLHKEILAPNLSVWYKTLFFPQEESKRGQLEVKLNRLLCLSEKEDLPIFSSMENLIKKWCDEVLGTTTEEINRNSKEKSEIMIQRLKNMNALYNELKDRNVLHDASGNSIIDKSKDVPLIIILGRMGYWFPTVGKFRRCDKEICKIVKNILEMNPNDLCKKLGVNSRNASFQKALVKEIDSKFKDLSEKYSEKRLFSPADKQKKLKEQNFKCSICNETILEHQRSAGDHIVEFCRGGNTTYENLQIVHKLCHETKNMLINE